MDRMKIAAQVTMDLLVTYEPNDSDWYAGLYIKNIRDEQTSKCSASCTVMFSGGQYLVLSQTQEFGVSNLEQNSKILEYIKKPSLLGFFFTSYLTMQALPYKSN